MVKSLQEKITEAERNYQLLANNMVAAIGVLNLQTLRYEYVSPSIEKLRGFTVEEFIEMDMEDSFTPESYKTMAQMITRGAKRYNEGKEAKGSLEVEALCKDGSTVWLDITAKFFNDVDGAIKVIGISKDITQRKKVEKQRDAYTEELKRLTEEQARLLKENKILRGLLPICAGCKKIRDENGAWVPVEDYISSRTEADFTHTICPPCKARLYPELGQTS